MTALKKNLICLLLGLISALALPPVSWPIFFLLGFGGFAFFIKTTTSLKQCFWMAWLFALGYHLAGLYWISASLFVDIHRYFWVLPFSLLALPCYLALIFGAASLLAHRFRGKPVLHSFVLAVTLFVNEIIRGTLFGGFPWNLFGYIWSDTLPLIQSVCLFGIHGLTFLTLLAGAFTSLLFIPLRKASLIAIALLAIVFSGLTLWGENRLNTTATLFHDTINLRLVQPAIAQSERKTPELRITALASIVKLSKLPSQKPVTHIIWPETASPFFLAQNAEARSELKHIIPKGGALLSGSPSRDEQDNYYNSLVVMNDKGDVVGVYDKSHLVPFGEFIPFRNILKTVPVAVDVIGTSDFSAGAGPKTLRAPALPPFSTMICYEAIFSGDIVDEKDPPQTLLQITNDAWFGDTSGPYQHLAMARVRAIEEGLPLIRVANSGVSAIVDPLGRMLQSLSLDAKGVIDTSLPKALEQQTLFVTLLRHSFAP